MRSFLVATPLLLAGCAGSSTFAGLLPSGRPDEPRVRVGAADQSAYNDQAAGWEAMRPAEGTPVLYGRDGSPVGPSPAGEVVQSPGELNPGVDPSGGSRAVLLELYSKLMNEHNDLQEEFDLLAAENDAASGTVEAQAARIAELEGQLAGLSQRTKELEASELELAGRLAQAQIGRLEAERALLEASLEWRRMNAANTRSASEEPRR